MRGLQFIATFIEISFYLLSVERINLVLKEHRIRNNKGHFPVRFTDAFSKRLITQTRPALYKSSHLFRCMFAQTNSAALAQILAKDYNKAKNTLANVERPDAYTDYLMAVLGARTNNSSMVTSSLKSAVAKDSSLAKKAATDLEFAKFFTNADFMNIIK